MNDSLLELLENKKLLIFDFDGTIANTSALHAQAFSDILNPLGIPVDYQAIAGLRTTEAILRCFQACTMDSPDPSDLQVLVSLKQKRVRDLISIFLEPLPNIDAFISWASSRYILALVTSGSKNTVSLAMNKLGYSRLFRMEVYAEDVAEGKPSPEGFLRVLQVHRILREDAIVFEDSEVGFKAARSAGIQFIDVTCPLYGLNS